MARARAQRTSSDIWPGFVDVLSGLLLVFIFLLVVFGLVQFFLTQSLTVQGSALQKLQRQVTELADLLSGLTRAQLPDAVAVAPPKMRDLSPLLQNYVAAMVEQAAHQRAVPPPSWGRDVRPLEAPHFATPLRSLRLHLLRAAPAPFKRRNIFVDSGVGARV